MTRPPGAVAVAAITEAKELIARGDTAGALARYLATFERLVDEDAQYDASTIAHMAGTVDGDLDTMHVWNVLALSAADAEPDRASIAWFYPSLYNNLAHSSAQLGDRAAALESLRRAWANVDALEPGPYAERVRSVIRSRLDELEAEA